MKLRSFGYGVRHGAAAYRLTLSAESTSSIAWAKVKFTATEEVIIKTPPSGNSLSMNLCDKGK